MNDKWDSMSSKLFRCVIIEKNDTVKTVLLLQLCYKTNQAHILEV